MGGFARRTRYWNEFSSKFTGRPFLKIDGGSLFSNGPAESPVNNRWMLEGTLRSGLDAINITAWDLPIWQEFGDLAGIHEIRPDLLKLPLVSANLRPKLPNFPAFQRYIIKEVPADPKGQRRLRVAITGVIYDAEERVPADQFEITNPERAAARIMDELDGRSDIRILLTDATIGKAMSLAITVPGISLIVVTHNYAVASDALLAEDTLVVTPVNEGRVISEVRVALDPVTQQARLIPRFVGLDHTVPDDPAMAEIQRKAQEELEAFKKKGGRSRD
jgi:hypothetical protein